MRTERVEVKRVKHTKVDGEYAFQGEEIVCVTQAIVTSLSIKSREFYSRKFDDVSLKVYIDYMFSSNVDEECVVYLQGEKYAILEVTNEGFANRYVSLLLSRKK